MFHLVLALILTGFIGRASLQSLPLLPALPASAAGEVLVRGLLVAPDRSVPVPAQVTRSIGVVTTARAAAVADAVTGVPLYEKNADEPLTLASITKLMTALVVLDLKPDWNNKIIMESGDFVPGGNDRLHPGDELSLRELFGLSLVASENNATMALARSVSCHPEPADLPAGKAGGSRCRNDFVALMNAKAKSLQLSSATFVDPTGLDEANRASAKDVAWLARAAFAREEIRSLVGKSETRFVVGGKARFAPSTDDLLQTFLNRDPYMITAGKTGSLNQNQYNLALQIKHEDGGEAIVVVLGSDSPESRFQDAKALATWVFKNFSWRERSK